VPLGPGTKYRVKDGVRLAFQHGKVVEAVKMKDVLAKNLKKRKLGKATK